MTRWAFYKETDRYLLVVLDSKLMLASAAELPSSGFEFGNTWFHNLGFGEMTGFYDWLRDSNEHDIVGVDYQPLGASEVLIDAVPPLPYVARARGTFQIFFSEVHHYDPARSGGQHFTGNSVFQSDSGVYAVSFDLGTLPAEARRKLGRFF